MSKSMPFRKTWYEPLAEDLGETQAKDLLSITQNRYDKLYAERTEPPHRALNQHLDDNILPGLALYQVLREQGWEEDKALEAIEHLFATNLLKRRRMLEWIGRTPVYFSILRRLTPRLLDKSFPSEGWEIEWVKVSSDVVAFNMHSCFYLDTLSAYGAPELTPVFCRLDDVMYENLSTCASWERTKTLGFGDNCCNFCFRRQTRR